uniref:Protein lifeguard 4 n=1 Tax=Schistosoma mansoni TaxID=6183 RepID=A0A5K4F7B2_SCHMA
MVPIVENAEWERVNVMKHVDRLRVVSTYTETVLILVVIQILITLFIIMLSSIIGNHFRDNSQPIPSIVAGLFILIAFAIALLIILVKKISEKYPLNVVFVIIYSISMAIATAIWNIELCILYKLAIFGISLVLFTSALLIGAAIKANLLNHLLIIIITLLAISIVILIVGFVLSVWLFKYATIGVYVGVQILFFIITIFISHFTVGKSRYLILYPNYSLAAIILYTIFFSTLSVNTDIWNVYNKTGNCSIQFELTENVISI